MKIRDLLDPSVTAPRSIERHHLFPKAHLAANGVTARTQVNAIANMAFLDWPENATISADRPIDYWPAMTEAMAPDQLDRQRYWHALPVGWEQLDYPTLIERRRSRIAEVVKDGFDRLWGEKDFGRPPSTLADLLAVGESQTVEFKSTARWNLYTSQADKKMEHIVTKAVCGFLNAEGGTLLIGVGDDGSVLGLADDLKTFGAKADLDAYELFLRQHLDNSLSIQTAGIVNIRFESVDGVTVCEVSVAASGKPVFAKSNGKGGPDSTEFWVRIGNATKQFHGDDMVGVPVDPLGLMPYNDP